MTAPTPERAREEAIRERAERVEACPDCGSTDTKPWQMSPLPPSCGCQVETFAEHAGIIVPQSAVTRWTRYRLLYCSLHENAREDIPYLLRQLDNARAETAALAGALEGLLKIQRRICLECGHDEDTLSPSCHKANGRFGVHRWCEEPPEVTTARAALRRSRAEGNGGRA